MGLRGFVWQCMVVRSGMVGWSVEFVKKVRFVCGSVWLYGSGMITRDCMVVWLCRAYEVVWSGGFMGFCEVVWWEGKRERGE